MTDQEINRAKELSASVAGISRYKKGYSKEVVRTLSTYMPSPEKEMVFESPESIASKLNSLPEGSLGSHLIKNPLTPKDVIEEIKKLSGNDRLDISNIRNGENLARAAQRQTVDMNDMRWHGGTSSNSVAAIIQVDVVNSTNGQTVFTATKNVLTTLVLTVSGANQTPGIDYTVSGNTATLTNPIPANQPVIWVYIRS